MKTIIESVVKEACWIKDAQNTFSLTHSITVSDGFDENKIKNELEEMYNDFVKDLGIDQNGGVRIDGPVVSKTSVRNGIVSYKIALEIVGLSQQQMISVSKKMRVFQKTNFQREGMLGWKWEPVGLSMAASVKKKAGVAETIMQQIRAIDHWALGSWGAKDYIKSDKSGDVLKDSESRETLKVGPYLKFTVKGSKLRGFVIIALNGLDYYDLLFYTKRGIDFKLKERIDDIDVGNLVEVLDRHIG